MPIAEIDWGRQEAAKDHFFLICSCFIISIESLSTEERDLVIRASSKAILDF
jgi:hypothetical protein